MITDTGPCLAYGAVISLLISALKKVPLVKQYPKVAAAVVSGASAVVLSYFSLEAETTGAIVRCFAEQFAAAIATHEAVVQPVKNNVL